MPKLKEKDTRTPELHEIIDAFEDIRVRLFKDKKVSATKFNHYQSTLHVCKNIVRQLYGVKPKGDTAWVK